MKTSTYNFKPFVKHYARTLLWSISILPLIANAQTGLNDASFNTSDNTATTGPNNIASVSAVQPDSKILIAGSFTKYNGITENGIVRLQANGQLDKTFNVGAGGDAGIRTIAIHSGNKILIGGAFSVYNRRNANGIARLNTNGTIDHTFYNHDIYEFKADITKLLVQPNKKILAAGSFVKYADKGKSKLIRYNENGTLDTLFTSNITDSIVYIEQIALQPDGKIIVTGDGGENGRLHWKATIRLNNNGTRDYSFALSLFQYAIVRQTYTTTSIAVERNGNILLAGRVYISDRPDPRFGFVQRINASGTRIAHEIIFGINDMGVQSDGKIVIAGHENVRIVNERYTQKRKVARLNADLTIDTTFAYEKNPFYFNTQVKYSSIETIKLLNTGKIFITGDFNDADNLIENYIGRLNANGSVDNSFNKRTSGCDGTILASAAQTDDKLIIGGQFSLFNSYAKSNIARLKKNGTIDNTFNVGSGTNGSVRAVAIQSNGKIIIGGSFTSYDGHSCFNIARLNANGSFDASFKTQVTGKTITKIVIAGDGKILIGGYFSSVNGKDAHALARVLKDGDLDATFKLAINEPRTFDFTISDCKISANGAIYIALYSENIYVTPYYKSNVFRLKSDGSSDPAFKCDGSQFYRAQAIAFSNDKKILVAYSGNVTKLNFDGSPDTSFHGQPLSDVIAEGHILTINVLKNNKILIGGDFDYGHSALLNHIGLLNSDGTIDYDFVGVADQPIYTTTAVENSKMIIAGSFGEYTGAIRNSIARIDLSETTPLNSSQGLTISQNELDNKLAIYPNPAASDINIENLKPGSMLRIFNSIGKQMYSGIVTAEKYTLELSAYSSGIYVIVAENDNRRITGKFIVNK